MSIRPILLAFGLGLGLALGGCYRPHGAAMPYTGQPYTYYSTDMKPKNFRLLDVRTDDVVFSMDIPVGTQLTVQFLNGEGDDLVYTPDLMLYQVFDLGTTTGKLRSSMSVPDAGSRRIEVSLRPGPEYLTPLPDRELRTDELEDRPAWWTPEGGDLPDENVGLSSYHN
ncbi:MAG: hypothetical protein HKO59_12150 [Phycisphaerales bacterium]|nr:hypothetical protein [Phycisphaerae bacterium]NNF43262.1 hypothetical protein [Phycisphaerales bacterium]NNM26714.1 hypothetical protein [Phycisphaerales bacterium]